MVRAGCAHDRTGQQDEREPPPESRSQRTWSRRQQLSQDNDRSILQRCRPSRTEDSILGEFGSHDTAEMSSRSQSTAAVRIEAERPGASWAYWDFATDFGAYDLQADAWREPLRNALLGRV
jgi:hypothetical protein